MLSEVYSYLNYREFLQDHFKSLPRGGFGQLSRAAEALGMQPSLLTRILQGAKNLTPEQAFDMAAYIQLDALESEYFITLVHWDRAGNDRLREHLFGKLREISEKAELLKSRLPPKMELPENVKAQFYSQWSYSAVRMLTSVPEVRTTEEIAERLGISRPSVVKILEFLLASGLVESQKGEFKMGPLSTHIGAGEMLVARHHTNWRLKAIEKIAQDTTSGLHFTSPISISRTDMRIVQKMLIKTIDQVFDVVDPSPAQEVACLCVDFFQVTK
jgi:uncharacterized protein (TIGR02147 family)